MTDQELWNAAVRQIAQTWSSYPSSPTETLAGLIRRSAACKESLHSQVTANGADRHCVTCRGQCCFGGKHHVTIVDILAHLALGRELFSPRFDAPACPYLGDDGCMMEPALRPRTCIIFLCDTVLDGLDDLTRAAVARLESELELLYRELGRLLAISPARSLLLAAESAMLQGLPLLPAVAAINKE
jgi:hypothetical protein